MPFPLSSGLIYHEEQFEEPVAVLARNGTYIPPNGGWHKQGRIFVAIEPEVGACSTSSVGTKENKQPGKSSYEQTIYQNRIITIWKLHLEAW